MLRWTPSAWALANTARQCSQIRPVFTFPRSRHHSHAACGQSRWQAPRQLRKCRCMVFTGTPASLIGALTNVAQLTLERGEMNAHEYLVSTFRAGGSGSSKRTKIKWTPLNKTAGRSSRAKFSSVLRRRIVGSLEYSVHSFFSWNYDRLGRRPCEISDL